MIKSIIVSIALALFLASCSGQPSPDDALPNDVTVDNKINNASENEQDSDARDVGMNSRGSNDGAMKIVYFEFDKFNLTENNMEMVSSNSDILSSNSASIKLEGNCDEWGSDEYNYALGLKRAKVVKNAIVSNGVDEARISMVSYGESNHICSGRNKSCWSKNRRVETKFLP